MEEYPGNSHRSKEEPERVVKAPVATGAVRRNATVGSRLRRFFAGADAKTVGGFVLASVIFPALQDMLRDAIHEYSDNLIYGRGELRGNSRRRSRSGRPGEGNYSYDRISSKGSRHDRGLSERARRTHDFGELTLPSRVEADEVLRTMYDILGHYEVVTVADLYDLVNIAPTPVDRRWGWTHLNGSAIRRVRGGDYLIDLPRPEEI